MNKKNFKDNEELRDEFGKYENKAEEMANDKETTDNLLNEAMNKANKDSVRMALSSVWENLNAMFGMVHDWLTGNYKDTPIKTIVSIIGAIIYFVSPIDFIPDFIPFAGYLDDVAVVGFVAKQVLDDINDYLCWKKNTSVELD